MTAAHLAESGAASASAPPASSPPRPFIDTRSPRHGGAVFLSASIVAVMLAGAGGWVTWAARHAAGRPVEPRDGVSPPAFVMTMPTVIANPAPAAQQPLKIRGIGVATTPTSSVSEEPAVASEANRRVGRPHRLHSTSEATVAASVQDPLDSVVERQPKAAAGSGADAPSLLDDVLTRKATIEPVPAKPASSQFGDTHAGQPVGVAR